MTIHRMPALAASAAIAFSLAACDSDPVAGDRTALTVLLTDAPGDLVSAEVEILEMSFQGGSGTGDRVTIYDGGETFDLLTLQDGVTAELARVTVPAGVYNQLRLVIGDATLVTEGGETYSTDDGTLLCPSCAQSGLKINLPDGGLDLDDDDATVVIDFDVAQSFGKQRGASGRWVMHPVINATLAEAAASISGTVALHESVELPECGGGATDLTFFRPTAVAGDLSLSATTDVDGELTFPYVPAGTYAMGYVAEVEFDNDEMLTFVATPSVPTIELLAGGEGTVDYVITSATCGPIPED